MAKLDPTHAQRMINLEISAQDLEVLHQNLWIATTLINLNNKLPRKDGEELDDCLNILESLLHDSLERLTKTVV